MKVRDFVKTLDRMYWNGELNPEAEVEVRIGKSQEPLNSATQEGSGFFVLVAKPHPKKKGGGKDEDRQLRTVDAPVVPGEVPSENQGALGE